MKKNSFVTDVIFRKFKDGEILALFPYEIETGTFVLSYQHIGQHSGADYQFMINGTKPAKPEEFTDLKKEIENFGYNLRVIKKRNYNKFLQEYYKRGAEK